MRKYKIGLYEKAMPPELAWKEKFSAAKEAGYDYVELSIDATEEKIHRINMSKEERFTLCSLANEIDISIGSVCVSALTRYSLGNEDKTTRQRGMDIAERAVELSADLGSRVMMIPGYDVYYGESTCDTKKLFRMNVERLVEKAAGYGVVVGFETMENSFMNTVEKAMKYIMLCNSSYLQIYPDTGNLTNAAVLYKHDVLEDMELGRGHIAALHLKETMPGRFREVPYGAGHVNFRDMIEKAWSLGVRRYVTEFWYTGNPSWKCELKRNCAMFRQMLDMSEKKGTRENESNKKGDRKSEQVLFDRPA